MDFRQLLSPANIISLIRIPLAVVMIFVYQNRGVWFGILTLAIISDALDGYVARKTRPTRLGALLDPLCDKIFFGILTVFLLAVAAITPVQLFMLLFRDAAVTLLMLLALAAGKKGLLRDVKARLPGKIVTVGQFAGLCLIVLGAPGFQYLAYAVFILSIVAIADYYFSFSRKLRNAS
jgi:phosphatidylglycerophosphate synthase